MQRKPPYPQKMRGIPRSFYWVFAKYQLEQNIIMAQKHITLLLILLSLLPVTAFSADPAGIASPFKPDTKISSKYERTWTRADGATVHAHLMDYRKGWITLEYEKLSGHRDTLMMQLKEFSKEDQQLLESLRRAAGIASEDAERIRGSVLSKKQGGLVVSLRSSVKYVFLIDHPEEDKLVDGDYLTIWAVPLEDNMHIGSRTYRTYKYDAPENAKKIGSK